MAEERGTSGQGRDLLLNTGEAFPEHVRQHLIAVGKDDDRDMSNPLGNLGTSSPPSTNPLGVSVTQNESPVPGPSSQPPLQSYSLYQHHQGAPTTDFRESILPQHIMSQAMEGILDQNHCSYSESPHQWSSDTETTHPSLATTPLGSSDGAASNHIPVSPSGYNPSAHLDATPSTPMNAASPTHHGPDHSTLQSLDRQDTPGHEGDSGDDENLSMSTASVDAERMDIDEEGSENTSQRLWDLSQIYTQGSSSTIPSQSAPEALLHSPLPNSLTYASQAGVQTVAAAEQPGDSDAISIGSSTGLPLSTNDPGNLDVLETHSTTQTETETVIEDGATNDLLGPDSIPEPHSLAAMGSFDFPSLMQDTNGLVFGSASQTQASTNAEAEHSAGLTEGTNLPLQQSEGPLVSWSSQDPIHMPDLALLPSLQANMAEPGDIYDIDEDYERNYDVCEFFEYWRLRMDLNTPKCPNIGIRSMDLRRAPRPGEVSIEDLDEQHCDYQGINWSELGALREEARALRKSTYVNYTNIPNRYPSTAAIDLPNTNNHFRFRRMTTRHKAYLSHFQLRNVVSATSKNAVYYAGRSKVICADPTLGTEQAVMDFSKPSRGSDNVTLQRISTMTASDGVLIAGGFEGEYAMMSLSATYDSGLTSGLITSNKNGITNHIHTFKDRRSGSPLAVFSSNDDHIRVLDCNTNAFTKAHRYPFPVNCAATSPDGRLRLLVGDHCHPWVVDAESGAKIVRLPNHRDFGFACAWADDGIHMATGNQDGIVQVWDARMFRRPLQIIGTTMGGVRSMRFSPVGSGKRVLLMAEPADIVSVVDAVSFESTQLFDFFGDIGGVGFVPDGGTFFVANTDAEFGGLLEFERVGFGEPYGAPARRLDASDDGEMHCDWRPDAELEDDGRVEQAEPHRRRRGLDLHGLVF
ncbi:WD40/YVTN repeat-like-containing domain [Lasallia pustulata]|uniref:WD40/YVTN repeat-like-containing domain n=1 Tax=Lasallia pustulata TaxID=136370 RepID=A0A1W5CTP7_9LECA|nr:WD40/YVTN repeat-like-containing domain [Lasallia pustulata]